jgi:hypothetical protein
MRANLTKDYGEQKVIGRDKDQFNSMTDKKHTKA